MIVIVGDNEIRPIILVRVRLVQVYAIVMLVMFCSMQMCYTEVLDYQLGRSHAK